MRNELRQFVPLVACIMLGLVGLRVESQEKSNPFALKKGDRIAWVGSSSTNIGVWPKTMEFLLRTRHPELQLSFKKFSTGGGSFATGAQNLDKWLDDFQPTVVFLNYGGNDAGAGEKGLPTYKDNMAKCVAKIEKAKARFIFTAFQGADVRKAGEEPAARRKLYAETQIALCKEKGWPIVDIFHPTDRLQRLAQKDDDKYSILSDKIHLTAPAYIAWGYYLYDALKMPSVNELKIDAVKNTATANGCKYFQLKVNEDRSEVSFERADQTLPILPPGALPPRKHVPLEELSDYRLCIQGLKAGDYEIQCEKKALGTVSAAALDKGINLNSLILDNGIMPAWDALAKQIWAGKDLDQIGNTKWSWRVVRK